VPKMPARTATTPLRCSLQKLWPAFNAGAGSTKLYRTKAKQAIKRIAYMIFAVVNEYMKNVGPTCAKKTVVGRLYPSVKDVKGDSSEDK